MLHIEDAELCAALRAHARQSRREDLQRHCAERGAPGQKTRAHRIGAKRRVVKSRVYAHTSVMGSVRQTNANCLRFEAIFGPTGESPCSSWTNSALRSEKEFGIVYEDRSGLIALLHRLGLEYRKPKVVARKLEVGKQKAFIDANEGLSNDLPADEAVMFVDAVHPTHAVRPAGCWARRTSHLRWPRPADASA